MKKEKQCENSIPGGEIALNTRVYPNILDDLKYILIIFQLFALLCTQFLKEFRPIFDYQVTHHNISKSNRLGV